MADLKTPVSISLAALLAAGHIYNPTAFKDAPPLASIPLTTGSTISGPTGPAGPAYTAPSQVVNAVTDDVIRIAGPVGLSAGTTKTPE